MLVRDEYQPVALTQFGKHLVVEVRLAYLIVAQHCFNVQRREVAVRAGSLAQNSSAHIGNTFRNGLEGSALSIGLEVSWPWSVRQRVKRETSHRIHELGEDEYIYQDTTLCSEDAFQRCGVNPNTRITGTVL